MLTSCHIVTNVSESARHVRHTAEHATQTSRMLIVRTAKRMDCFVRASSRPMSNVAPVVLGLLGAIWPVTGDSARENVSFCDEEGMPCETFEAGECDWPR